QKLRAHSALPRAPARRIGRFSKGRVPQYAVVSGPVPPGGDIERLRNQFDPPATGANGPGGAGGQPKEAAASRRVAPDAGRPVREVRVSVVVDARGHGVGQRAESGRNRTEANAEAQT